MRGADIVSPARSPHTKACYGKFNITSSARLSDCTVKASVTRSAFGAALIESRYRGAKYAVVTQCIAGGMDAAGLINIY